jgi:predicted O-methyltransferase YrrM
MYWLAGLERAGSGRLVTFDPNPAWAEIAHDNLAAVGGRFTSVVGTFEAEAARELGAGRSIDLAFVDAVHTSDVVLRQFEDVARRAKPGAIVVFDDINFSADMRFAWTKLANDPRVAGAATFGARVGMLELA